MTGDTDGIAPPAAPGDGHHEGCLRLPAAAARSHNTTEERECHAPDLEEPGSAPSRLVEPGPAPNSFFCSVFLEQDPVPREPGPANEESNHARNRVLPLEEPGSAPG